MQLTARGTRRCRFAALTEYAAWRRTWLELDRWECNCCCPDIGDARRSQAPSFAPAVSAPPGTDNSVTASNHPEKFRFRSPRLLADPDSSAESRASDKRCCA